MKPAPVPVFHYDEAKAADAYLAHVALLTAERADPSLKHNAAWLILRADAYEMFRRAYDGGIS